MSSKADTDKAQPPASTPSAQYSITQWSSNSIPIDPAIQQHQTAQQTAATPYAHYSYSSHYPQASYPSYQAFAATLAHTQNQAQSGSQGATTGRQTSQLIDASDLATLSDAIGSAGVDLRAEEETLQRSHEPQRTHTSTEDRTRKQPTNPSFDNRFLGATMRTIGTKHRITTIPEDSVTYAALALRIRLQELIIAMVAAARHRTDTHFDRPASLYPDGTPMWSLVVRSDVAKQLAALEKVEREEEMKIRRDRKERLEAAAAFTAQASGSASVLQTDGFDDSDAGSPKKKRKKEGPGVTARNMSEDVRKKMSNAVATQAAGLGKYAWMNAANAPSPSPGPKARPATGTAPASAVPPTNAANPVKGSWARPYVPAKKSMAAAQTDEDARTSVTLRDAMFVVEKERGHGGGRGTALGWI